jgi:flagellar motor switch protein FliG
MAELQSDEAEELARQIASTRRVDSVEARNLLEEFGDRFGNVEIRRARGGVDAAREILKAAFGAEKAAEIVSKAVPEATPKPFAFLEDLTFTQLANLLRKEKSTTLALVMSYIDPSHASRLLESLPDEDRSAIVLRLARTEKVSTEVLNTVESTLQEKLRLIGKDDSEEMDGRSALADILRYMDIADEKRLLDSLGDADPSLAEQVKEKLYTMDTVLHLRDRDLQSILLDMDEKEIALLLKGQPPEIRERINSSLSSRRRLLVADEGDIMGPIPRSEADTAVREFLDKLRAGEEAGTFVIIREETDLI